MYIWVEDKSQMEKCWSWFFPLYQLAYYLSYGNSHFGEVQTFHEKWEIPCRNALCSEIAVFRSSSVWWYTLLAWKTHIHWPWISRWIHDERTASIQSSCQLYRKAVFIVHSLYLSESSFRSMKKLLLLVQGTCELHSVFLHLREFYPVYI